MTRALEITLISSHLTHQSSSHFPPSLQHFRPYSTTSPYQRIDLTVPYHTPSPATNQPTRHLAARPSVAHRGSAVSNSPSRDYHRSNTRPPSNLHLPLFGVSHSLLASPAPLSRISRSLRADTSSRAQPHLALFQRGTHLSLSSWKFELEK